MEIKKNTGYFNRIKYRILYEYVYLFLQVPDKIIQSAAHLLLSVTTTIRPAFLFQIPAVVTLYESASQGNCQNLAQEVQATLIII